MSGVSDEEAKKIEDSFGKKAETKNLKQEKKEEKMDKKAPFIIRREVIINEEDSKKQENKKNNERNNNIGIVERKNKDFNIVYRNKPSKPKTLNELFGLNKAENKKETNNKEEKPQIQQPVEKKDINNNTNTNNIDVKSFKFYYIQY